uniref:Uncharacterized protein n=1 Tax=Trichogramma kaykai TaxID=54128 RepID=A0ABD2W2W5_9HYME
MSATANSCIRHFGDEHIGFCSFSPVRKLIGLNDSHLSKKHELSPLLRKTGRKNLCSGAGVLVFEWSKISSSSSSLGANLFVLRRSMMIRDDGCIHINYTVYPVDTADSILTIGA